MNNIISNIFCVKIIGYIDAHLRKKKIIVGSKAEGKETDGIISRELTQRYT